MSEENKRCPFCGNKDIDTSPISGAAWCYDCHSVANDVDRWNTRPLEDALQARIEVLEAKLETLTTAREIAQETRTAALEAALREIRDLARTGLPPDCIDEQYWRQHKLNEISGEADYALRKVEVKE